MECFFKLKKTILKKSIAGLFLLSFVAFGAAGGLADNHAQAAEITDISVAAQKERTLIPMGNAVGINIQSDGVMVVGVPDMMADGVSASPAREAGITAGDIITQIGTDHISSNKELKSAIEKMDGSPISIKVTRGNNILQLKLTPHKAADGHCELGLWMRDVIAGIGTMTFYDPETGAFGALGHSVNDIETGVIIPLRDGMIMHSVVTDVILGKAGMPGQLRGSFNVDHVLGKLKINTPSGIFGTLDSKDMVSGKKAMPIAKATEIKTGPATILSNVSGSEVREYTVEVTRVYTGNEAIGRSMMISVTDKDLISQTGGIVQGMSGSPIIQNGKLIGAVTHVLVNDPTRGYGISIENMLHSISNNIGQKAA